MIDHRIYTNNLGSYEIKASKNSGVNFFLFIYLFFSGFNFTTAMINHKFISFSAAQIYMIFHVFICKNINRKQFD